MSTRADKLFLNFSFDTNVEFLHRDANEDVAVVITTGQEEDDFPLRFVRIVSWRE